MKKIVPLLLLSPLLFLASCDNEPTNETNTTSSMEGSSTTSSTNTSQTEVSTTETNQTQETDTSPSETDEQTFHELDEIIGVWTNEVEDQTFAVTGRDYITDNKKYTITGTDVRDENGNDNYVISWDPDLFFEEYGEPKSSNPQPFIYDYDSEQDTLHNYLTFQRKTDDEQIHYVKNKLAGNEPVNLEQLLEVDDQHLLAYWYKATAESEDLDEQLAIVYQEISIDYSDLKLLTDEEYEQYLSIAKEIEDNYDYSFSDLNTALPRDIYNWYTDLNKDDNEKEVTEQLLPKIKEAREQYFERKDKSEQPYLDEVEGSDEDSKTNEADEPDEEMQEHIREKIKEEFPEDIPKDHIVYDMELEDDRVNIRVYENKEFNLQYQVGFVYDIEDDKLTKQTT